MSVQEAAVASQKFTCPSLSVVTPACTVAVNVTTVPPATEDTALAPEVRERVVALTWAARTVSEPTQQARQAIARAQQNGLSRASTFSPATVCKDRMRPSPG